MEKLILKLSLPLKAIAVTLLTAVLLLPGTVFSSSKLPPEKAGEIGQPTGKIAFTRDKSIWVMNADGFGQMKVMDATNSDGRLSWAPDGRRIAFTRSGLATLNGPDLMGGKHKVYDIFIAYLDSAENGNSLFWYRITSDLGSRDPDWSADGSEIIYWKDVNASKADAFLPNYQVYTIEPTGSNPTVLRKDWQIVEDEFLTYPSINTNGKIACVYFYDKRPKGIVVLDKDNFMVPLDTLRKRSSKMFNMVGPAWSPDGKWLACISNSIEEGGLYIVSADLSEKYRVAEAPVGSYMNTFAPSFSPNSKWLTYSTTDGSIWTIDITGNNARRVTGPGLDKAPAWSK